MFASFCSEHQSAEFSNRLGIFEPYAPAPEEIDREIILDHFPFVLGRHPDCDCTLFSRQVSRRHCQFFVREGAVWIEDLNSFNGTYLNEREIHQAQRIHNNDILVLHPYRYRCHTKEEIAGQLGLHLIPDQMESSQFSSRSAREN
jgi:pSer/pThr/pTyr-binding forkhead associated (FHA) protein